MPPPTWGRANTRRSENRGEGGGSNKYFKERLRPKRWDNFIFGYGQSPATEIWNLKNSGVPEERCQKRELVHWTLCTWTSNIMYLYNVYSMNIMYLKSTCYIFKMYIKYNKKWNNYQNLIARFNVKGDVLAKTSKLTTTLTILLTNWTLVLWSWRVE